MVLVRSADLFSISLSSPRLMLFLVISRPKDVISLLRRRG